MVFSKVICLFHVLEGKCKLKEFPCLKFTINFFYMERLGDKGRKVIIFLLDILIAFSKYVA
jgi:hypothetical protein